MKNKSILWRILNFPYLYTIKNLFIKRIIYLNSNDYILIEYSFVTNPVYPYAYININNMRN
jgi:hypothetical protein